MARHEAVPVDERWLGIDKRGIPYAAVALALIALLIVVIPAIDNAIEWDNPIVAGDQIDLGDGTTVTPPVGWQLEDGVLTTDEPINPVSPTNANVALSNGSTTIKIVGSGWTGTVDELLTQSDRIRARSGDTPDRGFVVTGPRSTVTTTSGLTGIQESFASSAGDGRTFAFVIDNDGGTRSGVVIAASGSRESLGQDGAAITDLVESLSTGEATS